MLSEHLFTYSQITNEVRYRHHSANSKDELDLQAEEIIDEMLDYDGTEFWARYNGLNSYESVYKDFCKYVEHRCGKIPAGCKA